MAVAVPVPVPLPVGVAQALTRVVSNGLNHIFVTETKNAAQMAIYQILSQILVASHQVAILVHSYS